VVEALARYQRPAFFDDQLTVRTELIELKRASLSFAYTVLRGEEVLVTGHTLHGCVNLTTGKPRRLPAALFA
jgi:acyl-CoA thioester hydrolase